MHNFSLPSETDFVYKRININKSKTDNDKQLWIELNWLNLIVISNQITQNILLKKTVFLPIKGLYLLETFASNKGKLCFQLLFLKFD